MESTVSKTSDAAASMLLNLHEEGKKARWAISADEFTIGEDDKPIAQGVGGSIYRVKWRGLDCAAKRLQRCDVKNAKTIEALAVEIELMSTLRHPNLILFLGACFEVFPPVLLMEYAPKGTLQHHLENLTAPLKKATKLRYALELALGMNFLHKCQQPVIHRDLKPSNILLDQDGVLKIADFGLAKFQKAKNRHAEGDSTKSVETTSYRYMAPEVYKREDYDEKVDVYSFAMVSYYILSGIEPFVDYTDPVAAVEAATNDGVRPGINKVKPIFVRPILQKGWSTDPKERQSVEEIVDALEAYGKAHSRRSCKLS